MLYKSSKVSTGVGSGNNGSLYDFGSIKTQV